MLSQIRHCQTDFLPYYLECEGDVAARLDGYYGGARWRGVLDNAIRQVPRPPLGVDCQTGEFFTDLYGSTWQVDCRPFKLVKPALGAPSLVGYQFPSVDACFEAGWEDRALQTITAQRDHFLILGFGFGLF